jgi:hypothetical protein
LRVVRGNEKSYPAVDAILLPACCKSSCKAGAVWVLSKRGERAEDMPADELLVDGDPRDHAGS